MILSWKDNIGQSICGIKKTSYFPHCTGRDMQEDIHFYLTEDNNKGINWGKKVKVIITELLFTGSVYQIHFLLFILGNYQGMFYMKAFLIVMLTNIVVSQIIRFVTELTSQMLPKI